MMDVDIDVKMKVKPCAAEWEAGILIRADHLADGGEGDDPVLGRNFMVGYRVALSENGVTLYRHRYDCTLLAHAPVTAAKLHIRARGNVLEVDVDGHRVITYEDKEPVVSGSAGFDARSCLIDGEITCTPLQ